MIKENKVLSTILKIMAIVIISLLLFATKSFAAPMWNGDEYGGMPSTSPRNPTTGMMPQLLGQERIFTGGLERYNFPDVNWQQDISRGTVYCANSGAMIRFAKYDPKKYYAGDKTWADCKAEAEKAIKDKLTNSYGDRDNFSVSVEANVPSGINTSEKMIGILVGPGTPSDAIKSMAELTARDKVREINARLAGLEKAPPVDDQTINSQEIYTEWDGDAIFGPKIAVMEDASLNYGYHCVESSTWNNNQQAFITTALEDSYTVDNDHKKYTIEDIQTAYWLTVDRDGIVKESHLTENGKILKQMAVLYEEYVNTTGQKVNESNAYVDSTKAQVVVNQNTKEYTVGPFVVNFPEYKDMTYVKALYIRTYDAKGGSQTAELVYDNSHEDFEIVFPSAGNTEVPGNNGLKKTYPKSGTEFYVKFKADKANYPKYMDLNVDVEYLAKTSIDYNELATEAHIYQYIGHILMDGDEKYRMPHGQVTVDYTMTWTESEYDEEEDDYVDVGKSSSGTAADPIYIVAQPYVDMPKEYTTDIGQDLTATLEGYRKYEVFKMKTADQIKLSIELGGKVWVDERATKESKVDGMYNNEVLMSGVKVTLYTENGTEVGTRTTGDNGEYLFEDIDAMFQYYVKFTYNGQYYEPTKYMRKETRHNQALWKDSSKGMDIASQRDAFNLKFEEVKSSPKNVCNTQSYTREELEKMGAIDKFGNPTGSSNAYVKECMMDAYSCNGTSTMDLYPEYKIFVESDFLVRPGAQAKAAAVDKINILYGKTGDNVDMMHHVNLGLTLRQTTDLALQKDIYSITLEIDGKEHTYRYNQRENKSEEDWKFEVRISNGYYDEEYTREVFREDYDYKASIYQNLEDINGNKLTAEEIELLRSGELEIYVKYRISIQNFSDTINTRITEVVDYYDKEFTLVGSDATGREAKYRPYIGNGNTAEIIGNEYLTTSNKSIYNRDNTSAGLNAYNRTYITGLESTYLHIGESVHSFVTYRVNKETRDGEKWIILDESVDGKTSYSPKENIAEINGYKTYYSNYAAAMAPNLNNDANGAKAEYVEHDVAGILDKDSTPGNVPDGNPQHFEDDTDRAPLLHIILNRDNLRTISGTVFEDSRNVQEQAAQVGNGRFEDGEVGVNGVRVQLVQKLIIPGTNVEKDIVWKEHLSGIAEDPVQKPVVSTTTLDDGSKLIKDYTLNGNGQGYDIDNHHGDEINLDDLNDEISNADLDPSDAKDAEKEANDDINGKYKFKGFIPGDYVVRFIYGSTADSAVGTKSVDYTTGNIVDNPVKAVIGNTNYNTGSYTGNDYKSTVYQPGVDNGNSSFQDTELGKFTYDYNKADSTESHRVRISDAKDSMVRREEVENYSKENVTNHKAEVLASFGEVPEYNGTQYSKAEVEALLTELYTNTSMVANTGLIDVNLEYNTDNRDNQNNGNIGNSNYDKTGYFELKDLDFGMQERPKAQFKVTNRVLNAKVTLANGSVLFDATDTASNVLWNNHLAHKQDEKNTYTEADNYDNRMIKVPAVRNNASTKGLVQLTMDPEIMDNATIQVTYGIFVANVGEVDYDENQFYYTGKVNNTGTIVKSNPVQLIDYVGSQQNFNQNATRNNMEFNKELNPDWDMISVSDILTQDLVNANLKDKLSKHNRIVVTDKVSADLVPVLVDSTAQGIKTVLDSDKLNSVAKANSTNSVRAVELTLSKVIRGDTTTDDNTYNNIVEIVKVNNDVGRRMNYSVVGNQDPTKEPTEIDADTAEEVVIMPPFGNGNFYYALGFGLAAILIVGLVLVIRFTKKKE
jgi:hypothetical protein